MGGSQDTNTVEADAAAALTPAGGPGTVRTTDVAVEIGEIIQCMLFSAKCGKSNRTGIAISIVLSISRQILATTNKPV